MQENDAAPVRYAGPKFALIPEWVLFADISDRAVRLYGVLLRFADHQTREAWPTRRRLAERVRVKDRRSVDKALGELMRIGALKMYPRWRNSLNEVVEEYDAAHPIRTSSGYELHG